MHTVRTTERTGKEGVLHISVALGKPEADFDVVVVVQPKQSSLIATDADDLDWPAGYFEATFGSIADETFERPPQGEMPKPLEFD